MFRCNVCQWSDVHRKPAARLLNHYEPDIFTGEYFHFIEGHLPGLGHPDGLMATRDSLFVADLSTNGNIFNGAGSGVIYQIKSLVSPPPPTLNAQVVGTTIQLTWDRGRLQEADEVTGPWHDVADAFSPHPIAPAFPRKFYRAGY